MSFQDERRRRGSERLARLDPKLEDGLRKGLGPVAPEFADWMVGFGFGEVQSRPGLDLQQRQLVTIGALTALGHPVAQLRGHVRAALNVGLEPRAIVEAVMQVALYAGFPAASNALLVVKEVFAQQGITLDDLSQTPRETA